MAASSIGIEDFLKCPICRDIFDDPQLLVCKHTLCNSCVRTMIKLAPPESIHPREISCPICRAKTRVNLIKADFKTKLILQSPDIQYETGTDAFGRCENILKMCQLCQKKPVKNECKKCIRLLCEVCSIAHEQIPAFKSHKIMPLFELISKKKVKVATFINKLQLFIDDVAEKNKLIQNFIKHADSMCDKLLKTAHKWKQKQQVDVTENHKQIADEILTLKNEDLEDVIALRNSLNEIQCKLKQDLEDFYQLYRETNQARFLGEVEIKFKEYEIIPLLYDFSTIGAIKHSHHRLMDMELIRSKPFAESGNMPRLTLNMKKTHTPFTYFLKSLTSPKTKYQQRESIKLQEQTYQTSFSIKAPQFVKKILCHDKTILCLYENQIDVYTLCGSWQTSFSDKHISQANGIVALYSELIVATMGFGLHAYKISDGRGKHIFTISEGVFCDVTSDGKKIVYALDYNNNAPTIRAYARDYMLNRWSLIQCIKLPYTILNPLNTLQWNGKFLLTTICSEDKGQILRYHASGLLLQTHTKSDSLPRLGYSQFITGDVLITDSIQNSLFVLDAKGQNKLLHLEVTDAINSKNKQQPFSVTVDEENRLWVSFNSSKTIVQYTPCSQKMECAVIKHELQE